MNTIGISKAPGYKYSVGVAYVALPSDLDRDKYIVDCYSNCHISIQTEDGGFHNRVPISPEVLSFINFPIEKNTLGSPVIYVTDDLYSQPFIVSRLMSKDELGDNKEQSFKFRRKINNSLVEINGSAQTKTINILVNGEESSGALNINLFNKAQDCKLKIDVQGDIAISNSGSTFISQQEQYVLETIDKDSEDVSKYVQTSSENKFYNKKFSINDGEESMVLGDKLKTFMDSFIDELSKITVTTALGQMPILNKLQILEFKNKTKEFLSQKAFLD